jgi:hypothetical protein
MSNAALAEPPKSGGNTITDYIQGDFDADGVTEALYQLSDPCIEIGCKWQLMDFDLEGNYLSQADIWAEDLKVAGDEGKMSIIMADGINWIWSGAELYPYHSLLEAHAPRDVTYDEKISLDRIIPDLSERVTADVSILKKDLLADPGAEQVVVVEPARFDTSELGSFYILNAEGQILFDGMSIEYPRLFIRPGGDLNVITISKRGLNFDVLKGADQ